MVQTFFLGLGVYSSETPYPHNRHTMSFMPILKTPVGQSRRGTRTESSRINTYSSGSTNERTERPLTSQVRFKSNVSSTRSSISLDQSERERRKREALYFLRKETRGPRPSLGIKPITTTTTTTPSSRIPDRYNCATKPSINPESLKTYELLGEKPISYVPSSSRSAVYDDQTIRNITKDSYRRNPLGYSSRIADTTLRISKPSSSSHTFRKNTLLNSLSNFGSKVFRSILYSEQDTNPIAPSSRASFSSLGSMSSNDQFLRSEIRQKEIDLQLAERRRYLDELNKRIAETEKQLVVESPIEQSKNIDKQIEKLDERLQNILEGVQSSSGDKLLKEMESIKSELTTLRRKQESNNMRFESKFEDMKLENQLNRQKFDHVFNELEEKRRELDLEKDVLIQKLKRNDKRRENSIIISKNEDTSDRFQIFEDQSDYEDGEEEENDVDILKYIVKNRRRSPTNSTRNMTTRIKQIKSNLKKIDNATKKV